MFTKVDNKIITRKIRNESISFLERIHGDICGPIHPPCGLFIYFMILIDASIRWSYICLSSTRNQVFAKLLVQLRVHLLNYLIKKICFDNTSEITSHAFHKYCISIVIEVEHLVAHVHAQNRPAKSLLKCLELVAISLLMIANIPMATWGYAILHVALLIRIKPTSYHKYSIMQLVFGQ